MGITIGFPHHVETKREREDEEGDLENGNVILTLQSFGKNITGRKRIPKRIYVISESDELFREALRKANEIPEGAQPIIIAPDGSVYTAINLDFSDYDGLSHC